MILSNEFQFGGGGGRLWLNGGFYKFLNVKKKLEKQRELAAKRSKRTITIFYCGANSPTKRIAYNLAEEIDQFDPVVANLSSGDINRRIKESTRVCA